VSRRLRVQTKARLRPDPTKLVVTVGPAVARHATVVGLPEEIDIRNAASVAEQLISAASSSSVVIADMTATIFSDCAGARAIVRAYDRAADSGAELRVVITASLVRRLFGLIGVDHLVGIYPSVEAARGRLPDGRQPAPQTRRPRRLKLIRRPARLLHRGSHRPPARSSPGAAASWRT